MRRHHDGSVFTTLGAESDEESKSNDSDESPDDGEEACFRSSQPPVSYSLLQLSVPLHYLVCLLVQQPFSATLHV
jgi:hypothetical protein